MNLRSLIATPIDKLSFAVVDTETTGMSPKFNRIIDIGIVKVKNGTIIDKWDTLIDPQQQLDPWITKYTHIYDYHLKGKPLFNTFIPKITDMLTGSVFVGHNVGFDYSFLHSEMSRHGKSFNYPKLCTVLLGRKLLPQLANAHLDAISDYYNITISARHRALPDAEATAIILLEFIEKAKKELNAKTFFDLDRIQYLKINKQESQPPPAKVGLFS